MSSKYPQQLDAFTLKKDRIVDIINGQEVVTQEGDDILASHVNDLQDSIVSMQTTLGANPNGSYLSVADRLNAISGISQLSLPSMLIFTGNAKDINGYSNKTLAATFIKKFDIAILGMSSIDDSTIELSTAYYVTSNTKEKTDVYFRIDCSDAIYTVLRIKNDISKAKAAGASGIYLDNFDYSRTITRAVQNDIVDFCHDNGLTVIVSSVKPSDVLSSTYDEYNNNTYLPTHLRSGDAFLYKEFAIRSIGYQSLFSMFSDIMVLDNFRNTIGINIYASAYIDYSDKYAQEKYFYITSASMMYCIDALYAGTTWDDTAKYKNSSMPLIGDFRADKIKVDYNAARTRFYRDSNVGQIVLYVDDTTGDYKYDFPNLKVPGEFIDSYGLHLDASQMDFSNFDASIIETGDLNSDRMKANVIQAIKDSPSNQLIPMSKIDQTDNSFVSQTVEDMLPIFDYTKISSTGDLYIVPKAQTIIAKPVTMQDNLSIAAGKGINVSQGYVVADTVTANTANIPTLETKNLKVDKMLNTPTIMPTNSLQILSNMLDIATTAGINKFNMTVYKDGHTDAAFYTEDQLESLEKLNEVGSYGTVSGSYTEYKGRYYTNTENVLIDVSMIDGVVVSYSTKIKASKDTNLIFSIYKFDANCAASIYFDGTQIDTIPVGTLFKTVSITVNSDAVKPAGQELMIIVESHNNGDPSIKITPNLTATKSGNITGIDYSISDNILRIDCYMDKSSKITGDLIQTGTVEAKNIKAKTITADSGIIDDAAINTAHIQNAAITSVKIGDAQIENTHIKDGVIDDAKISNLDGDKIKANTISTQKFTADVQQTLSDVETVKSTLDVQAGLIDMKADKSYVQSIEDNIVYKVEIVSTNGSMFRHGTVDTYLVAKVYHGKDDITDSLQPSQFVWHKINADGSEDTAWGSAHANMNTIHVTQDDVSQRATFSCDIIE